MREEFEKLPEIAKIVENKAISFCKYTNVYRSMHYDVLFINGAWYAFQEQQKKIDDFQKMYGVAVECLMESDYGDEGYLRKRGAIK